MPVRLKNGTIKRLHVNRQKVRQLIEDPTVKAVTVQTSTGPESGQEATIFCPHCDHAVAVLTQRKKQLGCGARVYVETRAPVEVR